MISKKPLKQFKPQAIAKARIVKKTRMPKMRANADSGNELKRLLSLKLDQQTPTRVIGNAFDDFALARILAEKRLISRKELKFIVGKFGPNAITALKRRNLKIEKAPKARRNNSIVTRRKLNPTDGIKPKAQAINADKLNKKAAGFLKKNDAIPQKKKKAGKLGIHWWSRGKK